MSALLRNLGVTSHSRLCCVPVSLSGHVRVAAGLVPGSC